MELWSSEFSKKFWKITKTSKLNNLTFDWIIRQFDKTVNFKLFNLIKFSFILIQNNVSETDKKIKSSLNLKCYFFVFKLTLGLKEIHDWII
jgi:hypothetical protein